MLMHAETIFAPVVTTYITISEEPLPVSTCNPIPEPLQSTQSMPSVSNENYTLYIGDSMLSKLNPTKMSSSSQKAFLFAYPGATTGVILSKLKNYPTFQSLDPQKVKKIFIVSGANNVDKALKVSRRHYSDFIGMGYYRASEKCIIDAKCELTQLSEFLNLWAKSAAINI